MFGRFEFVLIVIPAQTGIQRRVGPSFRGRDA